MIASSNKNGCESQPVSDLCVVKLFRCQLLNPKNIKNRNCKNCFCYLGTNIPP